MRRLRLALGNAAMPYIATCKALDIFDLEPSLLARTVGCLREDSQPGNSGVTIKISARIVKP